MPPYKKNRFANNNPFGTSTVKSATAVDEIIQPAVKPMPPAVPVQGQAAPVPATTAPKSAVDEIIQPTSAAPVVAAPAPAAAGPGQPGGATTGDGGNTGGVTTGDLGTDWEDWDTDPAIGGPPDKIHYTTVDIPPGQFDTNTSVKFYDPPPWLPKEDQDRWVHQNQYIQGMIEKYKMAQDRGVPFIDVTNEYDSLGFVVNPDNIRNFLQGIQREQKDLVKTTMRPGQGTVLPDIPGAGAPVTQPTTTPSTTEQDALGGAASPDATVRAQSQAEFLAANPDPTQ